MKCYKELWDEIFYEYITQTPHNTLAHKSDAERLEDRIGIFLSRLDEKEINENGL